jgi:hypothetical protein
MGGRRISTVPGHVHPYFLCPPIRVWAAKLLDTVFRAAVPEAPVNENGHTPPGQDEIRSAALGDGNVDPET